MVEEVCLKLKNDKTEYICNEKWTKDNKISSGSYTVIRNDVVSNMKDLIIHCLTYCYDIDIPENYKVTKIYSIVFSTGNFEPEDRTCSTCSSSILFSSADKKYIENKFKILCKLVGKKSRMESDKYFCWHTEDFASNQIIHSYNIKESYLVEEVGDN